MDRRVLRSLELGSPLLLSDRSLLMQPSPLVALTRFGGEIRRELVSGLLGQNVDERGVGRGDRVVQPRPERIARPKREHQAASP
jgi:hypothetical protein